MLEIGTKAPVFALPDQNGEMKSLTDYLGQKVILYFYSKDMIDEDGVIVKAFGKVKAAENPAQMLAELG